MLPQEIAYLLYAVFACQQISQNREQECWMWFLRTHLAANEKDEIVDHIIHDVEQKNWQFTKPIADVFRKVDLDFIKQHGPTIVGLSASYAWFKNKTKWGTALNILEYTLSPLIDALKFGKDKLNSYWQGSPQVAENLAKEANTEIMTASYMRYQQDPIFRNLIKKLAAKKYLDLKQLGFEKKEKEIVGDIQERFPYLALVANFLLNKPQANAMDVKEKLAEIIANYGKELKAASQQAQIERNTLEAMTATKSEIEAGINLAVFFIEKTLGNQQPNIAKYVEVVAKSTLGVITNCYGLYADPSSSLSKIVTLVRNLIFLTGVSNNPKLLKDNYEHIQDAIKALDDRVQKGFLRLEKLELEILSKVVAITKKLDVLHHDVQELRAQLTNFENRLFAKLEENERINSENELEKIHDEIKMVLAANRDDNTVDISAINLKYLLSMNDIYHHATRIAANDYFSGFTESALDSTNLTKEINRRKQLPHIYGLLPYLLSMANVDTEQFMLVPVNFGKEEKLPNPVYWARAVRLFLDARVLALHINNPQFREFLLNMWNAGERLTDITVKAANLENIKRVSKNFLEEAAKLTGIIADKKLLSDVIVGIEEQFKQPEKPLAENPDKVCIRILQHPPEYFKKAVRELGMREVVLRRAIENKPSWTYFVEETDKLRTLYQLKPKNPVGNNVTQDFNLIEYAQAIGLIEIRSVGDTYGKHIEEVTKGKDKEERIIIKFLKGVLAGLEITAERMAYDKYPNDPIYIFTRHWWRGDELGFLPFIKANGIPLSKALSLGEKIDTDKLPEEFLFMDLLFIQVREYVLSEGFAKFFETLSEKHPGVLYRMQELAICLNIFVHLNHLCQKSSLEENDFLISANAGLYSAQDINSMVKEAFSGYLYQLKDSKLVVQDIYLDSISTYMGNELMDYFRQGVAQLLKNCRELDNRTGLSIVDQVRFILSSYMVNVGIKDHIKVEKKIEIAAEKNILEFLNQEPKNKPAIIENKPKEEKGLEIKIPKPQEEIKKVNKPPLPFWQGMNDDLIIIHAPYTTQKVIDMLLRSPSNVERLMVADIKAIKKDKLEMIFGEGRGHIYSLIKLSSEKIAFSSEHLTGIVDLNKNKVIKISDEPRCYLAALSYTTLVTGCSNGKKLKIWNLTDVDNPQCTKEISLNHRLWGLVALSDKAWIISRARNLISIWSVEGEQLRTVEFSAEKHTSTMTVFTNGYIAVTTANGVRIYDPTTGEKVASVGGTDVRALAVLGENFLAVSENYNVSVYKFIGDKFQIVENLCNFEFHWTTPTSLTFLSERLLAVGANNEPPQIWIWDIHQNKLVKTYSENSGLLNCWAGHIASTRFYLNIYKLPYSTWYLRSFRDYLQVVAKFQDISASEDKICWQFIAEKTDHAKMHFTECKEFIENFIGNTCLKTAIVDTNATQYALTFNIEKPTKLQYTFEKYDEYYENGRMREAAEYTRKLLGQMLKALVPGLTLKQETAPEDVPDFDFQPF